MPLDAAVSLDQREISLERAALNLGIIPLPMTVLDAHKAAELAKHPGSLAGRYPGLFRMASCIGMLGCLLGGPALGMVPAASLNFAYYVISEMFIVAAIVRILVVSGLRFTGPADWQSRFSEELGNDVPAPLRDMARAIMQQIPECQIEVGELVQNRVVLDPYVVIHHWASLSPIVIGIWDGDQIVASATQIQSST